MSSSASTDLLRADPYRSPRRRRLLSLLVGVVLAAGLWIGLSSVSSSPPAGAHPFSLPRLGGGPRVTFPLGADGARRPVVLTFFASWCGPCRTELPVIAAVARAEARHRSPVRFIGIDDNDAASSGLAFAKASGVDFPVGRDWLVEVAPTYEVEANPSTVFIDADGRIAETVRGPVTRSGLVAGIARIERT